MLEAVFNLKGFFFNFYIRQKCTLVWLQTELKVKHLSKNCAFTKIQRIAREKPKWGLCKKLIQNIDTQANNY